MLSTEVRFLYVVIHFFVFLALTRNNKQQRFYHEALQWKVVYKQKFPSNRSCSLKAHWPSEFRGRSIQLHRQNLKRKAEWEQFKEKERRERDSVSDRRNMRKIKQPVPTISLSRSLLYHARFLPDIYALNRRRILYKHLISSV